MAHPYIGSSTSDLQALFAVNQDNLDVLEDILYELGLRKTQEARKLMIQIAQRIVDLRDDDEEDVFKDAFHTDEDSACDLSEENKDPHIDKGKQPIGGAWRPGSFGAASQELELAPDDIQRPNNLSRIRPPGTSGLPSAYQKPLNQDFSLSLPEGAELVDRYIAALGALITEIKGTGSGQKRYEIENGRQIEPGASETIYSFPFTDEADLFEEAQIEVALPSQKVEGSIISIGAGHLILALKENVGPEIEKALLQIHATVLLEALKEKIEQIKQGHLTINRALSDAVIGQTGLPPDPEPIPEVGAPDLNPAQQKALQRALTTAITYIWGPPGCGKTKTLGEIARAVFESGKRVLICSNTNKAVDQVLFTICEALTECHPAIEEGRVVRLGRIADDKLETKYTSYVTIDGIVTRSSAGLEARKCELAEEIACIDARTADAQRTIELFMALDDSGAEVVRMKKIVNDAATEDRRLQTVHEELQAKVMRLEAELQKRKKTFFGFLMRSEAAIQQDLNSARVDLEAHPGKIAESFQHYQQMRTSFESAQEAFDRCRTSVERKDRATAIQIVGNADHARAPLVAELCEIAAKIVVLRDKILRDAKILGATCTKSYMSAKDIGQVDLVIIDEASMATLPMIWFSAGLSRERVVVCGDFRQIAPIVPTKKQAIFDVLGNDVFTEIGMADTPETDTRLVMLDTQYRMRAPICNLISGPMYNNTLKTWVGRDDGSVAPLPGSFDEPLTIIDTSDLWPFESQTASGSRFNLMHGLLIRNLAWYFAQEGYVEGVKDLGICTPYTAQAKLIHKLLAGESLDRHIQVGTVHRFQGDERRTVVFEVPESHGGARNIGLFIQGLPPSHSGARLMNVAVSRAQDHLIVMANLTYLDRRLPSASLLRSILYDMQEHGRVIMGRELLELRPIESDLKGLVGKVDLDIDATTFGLFDERSFDAALKADISTAQESVVIFSGFITPRRVGEIGDLLRAKVADGVKVRCVTRPPQLNGTMDPTLGKAALDILEGIGCVVDCRANIHQKVVLIDKKVVWHGSLNALSHAHRTEESMTRVVNEGVAQTIAAAISKRRTSAEKAASTVAEPENPRCPKCEARTFCAIDGEGTHREFFYCEADCGW
jgi:hypothetical protein